MKTRERPVPLFGKAIAYIKKSQRVLLCSHPNPDMDACLSLLAFREFLRWLGSTREGCSFEVILYAPGAVKSNPLYDTVFDLGDPGFEICPTLPEGEFDLCVAFDYGDFGRLDFRSENMGRIKFFLGFDHHPETAGFPENGLEIITGDPSTTVLLADFFRFCDFPVSPAVATALFVGLVAETNRFSRNTDGFTFGICTWLAEKGATLQEVLGAATPKLSLRALQLQSWVLRNGSLIDLEKGLALAWFYPDDCASWGIGEENIRFIKSTLSRIAGIRLAAVVYLKADGRWYCSLRSEGGEARVIAELGGGGGHANAAGFHLPFRKHGPRGVFDLLFTCLKNLEGEK